MAPLRASLARSPPRLGRSQAGGLHPQDPQGCAPWCAFAHRAPAASVTQPEGFRARVRRWRGWATACGCPCPTPSPWRFFAPAKISKAGPCRGTAGGFGGRAPRVGRRWATRPRRWAVRGAAAGCARRPRTGRGCPRTTGLRGRAFEAVWLSLLKTRIKSAWPES